MTAGRPGAGTRIGLLTSVGRTLDGFFPPIVGRLRDLGFEVCPASGTPSGLDGWTALAGVGQRPSASALTGVRSLRRWAREQRLDVVVTNTATASALVRAAGVAAPVVYFCHGLHWQDSASPRSWPWQLIERALLPRTASILTLNRDDERWFTEHTAAPVYRLDCGIGVPLSQYPASPVPATGLQLLWAGDFTPRKRPALAVAVVRELVGRGAAVRLRMMGDGPLLADVRQQIAESDLDSTIETPGRGDVGRALITSSALLHTATWEGLPRVALEAAAVGRWTYGFDVKGLRDAPLVRSAPDADVPALAELIARDLDSGALREVPDVRGRLDVLAAADQLADVVLETVGRPRTGRATPGAPTG